MFPKLLRTRDGRDLLIREATPEDAGLLVAYLDKVSGESDFLTFGSGEFDLTEEEEERYLLKCQTMMNCLYLLAFVDETLAGALNFSSRNRPRLIHVGEFGITVQKQFWGAGIATALMDGLIDWARASDIITKINLKVRTDNHRAMELYFRKGFTVEGLMKNETLIDGKYYDILTMGLLLSKK